MIRERLKKLPMPKIFRRWLGERDALAATEAALIFPIMLTMILGIVDLGNAVLANQKAVRASQVVADLIARNKRVTDGDINDAVAAGRLAFAPLNDSSYGVDIVSIRFNADAQGQIVWRETVNMTGVASPLDNTAALAMPHEGVVMVTVEYVFTPIFGKFITPNVTMREAAFTRGRLSAVVNRI